MVVKSIKINLNEILIHKIKDICLPVLLST